jgi:hypothetical protein
MFRKNDQHWQMPMFSSIDSLPEKQRKRLEASWAETFYREVFVRIDEEPFAVLYSDEPSRPNIPINVLVGLDTLKSGYGWSDEEMYDHFCFDVQVRYALGYRDLSEGHFALRTVYNFRDRVTQHMEETGENLFESAFEQVTDEQLTAFELKTGQLRVDSTQIASNIRTMSRLRLLVEVLQRVHRMLSEVDQEQYADDFAPYIQGSSGQYTYRVKVSESGDHFRRIGELMDKLVRQLSATYAEEDTCQMLRRVFQEHFVVESDPTVPPSASGDSTQQTNLRPKEGKELSASSLQSPDDQEATYRHKGGQDYIGYVTNLTETCAPENDFQLIVKVQTESNNTDDAAMLAEALSDLVERTAVNQVHTDGGYNSPGVDEITREHQIEQIQTAIRGRKPAQDKLGLDDFGWETNADGQPQVVTCPHGLHVPVTPGRKAHRFGAAFQAPDCENCPRVKQCPAKRLKRKPERVLRFSQHEVDLALRRQRSAQARASGQDLRAAVEATVRSVKHPFGNGKVPVRGKPRVSIVMVGSALMSNLRRIHRHLVNQNRPSKTEKAAEERVESIHQQPAFSFWSQLQVILRSIFRFRPALAGSS